MTMLLLVALLFLGFAVYLVGEAATEPMRRQRVSVKRAVGYGRARRSGTVAERVHFRERVLLPAIGRLAAMTLRLNPKASVEAISGRLLAAGLASRITATQFLAL